MQAVDTSRAPVVSDTDHIAVLSALRNRLNTVLRGKSQAVEHVMTCLLARGHILIEDLPGLGKTTLAKALAQALGGRFARMQCTPDLLPSDVTGFNMFNQKSREFEFVPGPIFADVLLADEINRATPRAQSALLEAMAERQVTIDSVRHALPTHFFVIATQNPIEHHGTYPLPEAQLDRFALKLRLGYPEPDDELTMLRGAVGHVGEQIPTEPIVAIPMLTVLQTKAAAVFVAPQLSEYLVRLGAATRSHARLAFGLSPRALLMWQRLAQARAMLEQRTYVIPDDIQAIAAPLLEVHVGFEGDDIAQLANDLLGSVTVPVAA